MPQRRPGAPTCPVSEAHSCDNEQLIRLDASRSPFIPSTSGTNFSGDGPAYPVEPSLCNALWQLSAQTGLANLPSGSIVCQFMPSAQRRYDAVVVGSGPNGLVAAITLAKAGASVLVLEASDAPGGGCRSAELTLPGCIHDICSAVFPVAVLSPVFREIGLERLGVEYLSPDVALAHPLPGGQVEALLRSLVATAADLGADGKAWVDLVRPFADRRFIESLLGPMWFGRGALWRKFRFGLFGLRSCDSIVRSR